MLDIREILKSLSPEDRTVWEQSRTEMRRTYLNAHNAIVGVAAWDKHDDAFMDLIDIKIAVLFDRAGKIEFNGKDVTASEDAKEIEVQVMEAGKSPSQKYLDAVTRAVGDLNNVSGWPVNGK